MKYSAKRNLSLVISGIFIILALIVFFSMLWPTFAKINELNKKITQEQAQYDSQNEAVQIAQTIIGQYKSLVSVSQTISLSIPKDIEMQNLIAQINNISSQSGLLLQSIGFEDVSANAVINSKSIVQNYRTLKLSISLTGSYDSFKSWLGAIENNIRLMDVEAISFAGLSSNSNSSGNTGLFNFKVTINVYYQ